jgi:DNA-binding GntR family transcriptional regulator
MGKLDYEDLSVKVYRVLKEMILKGELKSGQKLQQEQIAEQLGVSRTPLLTAFSKLEREMLIEIKPRRGAFVRHFSKRELMDIYDIRLRLEPLGAFQAAQRADENEIADLRACIDEFVAAVQSGETGKLMEADYNIHMEIMQISKNDFLYQMASSFNIIVIANIEGFPKSPPVSIEEHEEMYAAIAGRDAERAERAMSEHISSSRELISHRLDGRADSIDYDRERR